MAPNALTVRVSRGSIDRATGVLQALATEIARRSWKIIPTSGRTRETHTPSAIQIGDTAICFSLTEYIEPVRDTEVVAFNRYRYEPSGFLYLQITHAIGCKGMQQKWSDRKGATLEDQISAFADGVFEASKAKGVWLEASAKRDRRNEAERKQREAEQLRQRRREEWKTDLANAAVAFHNARCLREMIECFRKRAESNPELWPRDAVARWIELAEAQAESADPFNSGYFAASLKGLPEK